MVVKASRSVVPGFGARLRKRRTDLGYTQRTFAKALAEAGAPIGFSQVALLEADKAGATGPTIRACAVVLDVSAHWLLCLTDDPTPR